MGDARMTDESAAVVRDLFTGLSEVERRRLVREAMRDAINDLVSEAARPIVEAVIREAAQKIVNERVSAAFGDVSARAAVDRRLGPLIDKAVAALGLCVTVAVTSPEATAEGTEQHG